MFNFFVNQFIKKFKNSSYLLLAMSLFFITTNLIAAQAAELRSMKNPQSNILCEKEEKVLFNCPIKNRSKSVSLCISKNFFKDPKNGYLKYRFGKPNKIELEYPKNKEDTFTYSVYNRWGGKMNAGLNLFSINFEIGGRNYHVYSDYSAETNKASYGVRVGDKEISCGRPVIDHLRKYENELGDLFKKD